MLLLSISDEPNHPSWARLNSCHHAHLGKDTFHNRGRKAQLLVAADIEFPSGSVTFVKEIVHDRARPYQTTFNHA